MIIIVMMVNAVGIAQVSHICKMAVAGIEKNGCHNSTQDIPPCCSSEQENEDQSDDSGCCANVVKYYHQKVTTTIQQNYKIQPLSFFISLFVALVPAVESSQIFSSFYEFDHPFEKNGKSIIIDLQTFLI